MLPIVRQGENSVYAGDKQVVHSANAIHKG